ncbi:MAG: winged helix-turn-helix domain-containing protein [Verrucomicrobiae bacterium]
MKPLTIADAQTMILALQDEIRRSNESCYDHRLHGVLLIAQGLTCPKVAELLGDAPRSVEYWVNRFETHGFAGLAEKPKTGRPGRLTAAQLGQIGTALRQSPVDVGMTGANLWDGKTLAGYLNQRLGVKLGVRQCQRLFRQLNFRLRKPRPVVASADPERQAEYKKTPRTGKRPVC